MEKKWIYLEEPDEQIIQDLSKSININPTLAKNTRSERYSIV